MYSASEFVSLVKKRLWISKPKHCSYDRLPESDTEEDDVDVVLARRAYVPVYVGEEAKRFEVPIKYLSRAAFQELLVRTQGDNGLDAKIDGPIRIACSCERFKQVLKDAKK
ncbi:Cysteinyl-tRNA synthetase, class Ia family protein, ARATH isoform 1 [Hibiscus syriacus]|uniref:Cysteinyl-tRNA synthetase, class Ia family protein, ARATH isoform 1 n=1 Tax=Hibiscus syriacus TaxID=106335 RepID=A0A6A2XVA4_HIBSY|nr:Cysteinyl-tRNA synthetase, class Ia family protein, ARATH isoform 1 [Hibiscus syriacus]